MLLIFCRHPYRWWRKQGRHQSPNQQHQPILGTHILRILRVHIPPNWRRGWTERNVNFSASSQHFVMWGINTEYKWQFLSALWTVQCRFCRVVNIFLYCRLLVCDTVQSGRWIPVFQSNVHCLHSSSEYYFAFKLKAACTPEMPVITYQTTWHSIPDDHSP